MSGEKFLEIGGEDGESILLNGEQVVDPFESNCVQSSWPKIEEQVNAAFAARLAEMKEKCAKVADSAEKACKLGTQSRHLAQQIAADIRALEVK